MNKNLKDLYIIKNKQSIYHNLCFNIKTKKFMLVHRHEPIKEEFITFFFIHKKNTTYSLKYYYNDKYYSIPFYPVYSKKNPLMFNIIIKNTNEMLQTNCKIICTKHTLLHNKVKDHTHINKPEVLFYFSYIDLKPCTIKIDDNNYNTYGYTRVPDLNKNKFICQKNKELANSWKAKTESQCDYIEFNDKNNKLNEKLSKCSFSNSRDDLVFKIPSKEEILERYKEFKKTQEAGKVSDNINKNKNIIDQSIGNSETQIIQQDLELKDNLYKDSYKSILENYAKYISDNITDVNDTRHAYVKSIKEFKETQKEYSLVGKKTICSGPASKYKCNVSSITDCQKMCNKDYFCSYVSYDPSRQICKIYNSCKQMSNKDYYTYVRLSLLRNGGYSIPRTVNGADNPPNPKVPAFIKTLALFVTLIVILCGSYVFYKLVKAHIKLILCNFNDCHIPWYLLDVSEKSIPLKTYI